MDIEFKNIEADRNYFTPTLRIGILWKYGNYEEALLNAYGKIKYKGKVIGRLELDTHTIEFKINPSDPSIHSKSEGKVDLSFTCELDANIINILNTNRKDGPRGDVLLQAEITVVFLVNNMSISFINEYKANDWIFTEAQKNNIKKSIGADTDEVSFLLYAYPTHQYGQPRTNLRLLSAGNNWAYIINRHITKVLDISIKASDWVHDFLPILGMGEYEIIEMPKINELQEDMADGINMLNEAKRKLYADLDIGASLTSLRNSLRKLKEFIDKNGGFEKLFDDNRNIIDLTKELQKSLYGATSRSQDSTASHTGGAKVEGYEAESMIFMAYSLYKLVIDRIKSRGP
jgi:hypothetical protein